MNDALPEVTRAIAVAEQWAACNPKVGGRHIMVAWQTLSASTADPDHIADYGMQIMIVVLTVWIPALLLWAVGVRDDVARWRLYRYALVAVSSVLSFYEAVPGYAPEDLTRLRAYCTPILEGLTLAIGAPLA